MNENKFLTEVHFLHSEVLYSGPTLSSGKCSCRLQCKILVNVLFFGCFYQNIKLKSKTLEQSIIWIFKIDGFESKESYKLCFSSNEAHGSRQSKHLHVTCSDDPDICVVVCAHNLFHKIISNIFHGDNKINSVNYNYGITISRRFMIGVQLSVWNLYEIHSWYDKI